MTGGEDAEKGGGWGYYVKERKAEGVGSNRSERGGHFIFIKMGLLQLMFPILILSL